MKNSGSLERSSPTKRWSKTAIGRLVILAGLIGLFLLVSWLSITSRRTLAEASPLVVDDQYLSLGELWEQQDYKRIIPLENRSGKEVIVKQFATSCVCLSVEPKSVSIPPGGKVNVTLTLDLTKAFPARSTEEGHSLCLKVVPVLDNAIRPAAGWTFCGRLRRFATFNPASVELWAGLYHGRSDIHRSVDIVLHVPAKKIVATSSSPFISTKLSKRAPARYQLDLLFSHRAPTGPFEHIVQLTISADDGHENARSNLEVKGLVKDEVEAIPGEISFGPAHLGTTRSHDFYLKSGTKEGIRLLAVDNPCPDASVLEAPAGGEGLSFRLVQRVKQAGLQNYLLSFRLESIGSVPRKVIVPVKVSYYGVTPIKEHE